MTLLNSFFKITFLFVVFLFWNQIAAQPLSGIQPKHGAFTEDYQVDFSWNSMPNAVSYTVMVAENSSFTLNMQQSPLLTQTFWTSNALTSGVWYWKVLGDDGAVITESATRIFRIFQPNNLPGNTLWLAADSNVSVSGGTVTAWNDISGNGHVMAQPVVADQPILVNNLALLNNQPAIRFDGVSDFLNGGDILNIGTNSLTTFILAKGTGSYYAKFGSGTSPYNIYGCFNIGATQGHELAGGGYQTFNTTNSTNYHVLSFLVNRPLSNAKLYRNFTQLLSGTTTGIASPAYNFTTTNPLLMGRYALTGTPFFLNGDISEVIFYNVPLSDADRQLVQNHLIYKYSPPVDLGKDTTIAHFCPINLTAPAGYTNLLWSTGATTSSISVSAEGQYWLQGTNLLGVVSVDTIQVNHPKIEDPTNTNICLNDSVLWDSGLSSPFNFLWSSGETTSSIYIDTPGSYSVQVTDSLGCVKNSTSYNFIFDNYSATAFLGNDTTLCSENLIALQIGAPETVSYLWPDFSTGTDYAVDTTGNYFVETINVNGCLARDTIFVTIMGQAPIADFSFQNECFGNAVDFVDLSIDAPSDVIALWDWDFGDGQNSTDENPSYVYATADTFSVQLYVETTGGCGAFHTEEVIIYALPVASFTYSGNCSSDAIQFTDQSTFGSAVISSWLWNFGQPSSGLENVSNLVNPTKIYNESGSFDVILEVTDGNNCVDDTTVTITVDPSPVAGFTADDGCEGEGIVFLNASFATPPSTISGYLWDFGDATFSIMTNPVKSFPIFGTQTVELEVTANNGCKDVNQQVIYINPNPIPEMFLGPMCKGTYTSLDNISTIPEGTISSTLWIINSTDSLSDLNAEYVFDTFGQQEIVLQTTSLAGCSAEISDFVDVVAELNAAFNAGSGVAAAGEPFQFTNESIGADDSFWDFGDGFLSTDFSPVHVFDDALTDLTLNVNLIVTNNEGCSDTTEQLILIEKRELDLALTNLYLDDDNGFYTIGVQLKNVGSVTIYEADLSIFLPVGLISSETWTGSLLPNASEIFVFSSHPNSFVSTENEGDAFICVEGIGYDNSSGIEQDLSNNKVCRDTEGEEVILLPLYPNPANEEITLGVLVTVDSEISLEIIDSRGRLVRTVIDNETLEKGLHNYTVNASQFEVGTYFVVLKTDEQIVYKMEIVH